MLGKLIKHEFKATSRYFIVLYGIFILITLFNKLFLEFNVGNSFLLDMFEGIFVFAYAIMCMAIFILTFIAIIQRFYQNLFGDEGYLMFTLPVNSTSHILSKIIVAFTWFIASIIIFFISISILLAGEHVWKEIIDEIRPFFIFLRDEENANVFLTITLLNIYSIISILYAIILFYMSTAIGHLFHKHKVLSAIGAFFFINMGVSTIYSVLNRVISNSHYYYSFNDYKAQVDYVNQTLTINIVFFLILGIAFFFITKYILDNKLNLE